LLRDDTVRADRSLRVDHYAVSVVRVFGTVERVS
jgi:hypothetical protein